MVQQMLETEQAIRGSLTHLYGAMAVTLGQTHSLDVFHGADRVLGLRRLPFLDRPCHHPGPGVGHRVAGAGREYIVGDDPRLGC
eukprot:2305889-Heterocapsa_arctica.AAC.1